MKCQAATSLSTDLIQSVEVIDHDDSRAFVIPDHPPEINDRVQERHLSQYYRVLTSVTLQQSRGLEVSKVPRNI